MRFCGRDNTPLTLSSSLPVLSRCARFGLVITALLPVAAAAQQICLPDTLLRPAISGEPDAEGQYPVELEGDEVESVKEETVTMRGNAQMRRGREALFADEVTYYRPTDEIEGKGSVVLYSPAGDRLEADYLKFQVPTHIGEADQAKYQLAHRDRRPKDPDNVFIQARGDAEKVYFEGHDVTRMENVTYTNCAKDQDDVILTARELTIDQGTGRGLAKNVTLRFKDVPVFYLPAISFPINDDRKTGLLFPSFGVQEDSGFVLATPFYWNIAPNYDATITPRVFTNRGLQMAGEFRYLHEDSLGFLYGEYMPDDSEFNDDRGRFWARHNQRFTSRWSGKVDYQTVSDDDYFDDFSNDIQVSATTFLPQVAEVAYNGRIWDFQARAFAYETVDENISPFNEPFDRLPQLRLLGNFPKGPLGIRSRLDTDLVRFDHGERTDGVRINATPSVWHVVRNAWGYVRPQASLRHISYDLNDTAPDQDSSPSVTVPILSLDSGIVFERNATWLGDNFIQTLEPRAFYVYIPEENQDDQPNFDTGDINFNNFGNIFREERFFGGDRVGDTNQVTLGLTSRMIHEDTGHEWIRASIGQILFLEDRDVTLFEGSFTDDTSDFLTELVATWTSRWSSYGFLQWNDDDSEVREGKIDIRYRASPRQFLDFEYRFSRDLLEQFNVFAAWPLTDRWTLSFTERYSLRDEENLETKVGAGYDACCWQVRGFFQSRVENTGQTRNAIIFELELTGLTRIRAGF